MKIRLLAIFIANILSVTITMNLTVFAAESTQSEQRSYFSLDPDISCKRASASDFHYYFIDFENNLYAIINDTSIEIVLNNVVEVAASYHVNFAVKTDGSLWSWSDEGSYDGNHCLGRTLDESDIFASMRKPEKVIDDVSYVYTSARFCYAILADDSLWGWGFDDDGYTNVYLGNGKTIGSIEPVKILDDVASITEVWGESWGSGVSNMFALKTDGSLWAWGTNDKGTLGLGNVKEVLSPQKVTDDVKSFVPGDNSVHSTQSISHYAIKKDNTLWSWGQGNRGNLGNGSTTDSNVPVKIMENVKAADVGMALQQDDSLWVWGVQTSSSDKNSSFDGNSSSDGNSLSDGDNLYSSTPIKVLDNVSEVRVYDYKYYAIKTDGSFYIFDFEGRYTLQNGEVTYSKGTPEKLMDGIRHVFIEDQYGSGLGSRVYIEKTDGSLWGWGKDFRLYMDRGVDVNYKKTWYNKPQKLVENPVIQRVYAGNDVEFVITDDSSLMWYMLYPSETTPVLSGKIIDNVEQIAVGYSNALICKTDGSIWAWRGNKSWLIGSIPTTSNFTLVKIMDGAKIALTASLTTSTVQVNGENIAFEAYNINGNNYFKLRDLAYVLSGTEKQFEISWDGANDVISLTSGKPYTTIGGEMTAKEGVGDKTAIPTNSKIILDGEEVYFSAYNIEGNNYFKLRDIGETFDFYVTWDGAKDTIVILTNNRR
ncbi:MAG: hypothetical protein FWH55_07290 [Oscillospiraceae bacterium]|nr:hypothetical protein [Oscillospiraceae bacterium]